MSLITTITSPITFAIPTTLPHVVRSENQYFRINSNVRFSPVGLEPLRLTCALRTRHPSSICAGLKPLRLTCASGSRHASLICAAALNATCAAEQTQTVTRQSSTITVAPTQGKEKSPDLDDGGAGLPPRDDGGGGGGGGGGGHWSGGFFLFGFLAFLGLLKDQESEEEPYSDGRSRRNVELF